MEKTIKKLAELADLCNELYKSERSTVLTDRMLALTTSKDCKPCLATHAGVSVTFDDKDVTFENVETGIYCYFNNKPKREISFYVGATKNDLEDLYDRASSCCDSVVKMKIELIEKNRDDLKAICSKFKIND